MTKALALLLFSVDSVRSLPQGAAKLPATLQANDVASVAESTNWTTLAESTNCKAKEVHSWCLNWAGHHPPEFGPGWYRDAGWPEKAPTCASDEVSAGLHKYRSTGCEHHGSHKYEWTVRIVCCPKKESCPVSTSIDASSYVDPHTRAIKPLTPCGASQYQSAAPTLTKDRECTAQPTCKNYEVADHPGDSMTRRTCKNKCAASEYYSSAGTCKALTVCAADQEESTPATATMDRECKKKPPAHIQHICRMIVGADPDGLQRCQVLCGEKADVEFSCRALVGAQSQRCQALWKESCS